MIGSYWLDFIAAALGVYAFHSALIGRLETHHRAGRSIITVIKAPWIRIALALLGVTICTWVGIDIRQKLVIR